MLSKSLSRGLAALLLMGSSTPSIAAVITYTIDGTASVRINGVNSAPGNFVITGVSDTNATPLNFTSPLTISFGGVLYTATGGYRYNAPNMFQQVSGVGNGFFFFSGAGLTSYNGRSALGPVALTGWDTTTIDTDRGTFAIQNLPTNLFFQAVVNEGGNPGAVPEPATWAMMIGGFGLMGGTMRYRRQRQTATFA